MNRINEGFASAISKGFRVSFLNNFNATTLGSFCFFNLAGSNTKAQKVADTSGLIKLFSRGERMASGNNFNGAVWLNRFVSPGDSLDAGVSYVTFEPGVRTNWHIHEGGQILLVTDGIGYYQEKGKPRQILHKGDVVKCRPGVTHWHGASPESMFAHLVVAPDTEKGEVIWMQKVTEEEYNGIK